MSATSFSRLTTLLSSFSKACGVTRVSTVMFTSFFPRLIVILWLGLARLAPVLFAKERELVRLPPPRAAGANVG
jgi:hypothetical protein